MFDYEAYDEARKTRRLQEKTLERLEKNQQLLENQNKELLEAFNKVMEELRQLREDLAPKKLDKPRNSRRLKPE